MNIIIIIKEEQRKIIAKGEEFLKKYAKNPIEDMLSIIALDEEDFKKMLKDFNLKVRFDIYEKSDEIYYDTRHRLLRTQNAACTVTKYTLICKDKQYKLSGIQSLIYEPTITPFSLKINTAYAIGLILLRNDFGPNDKTDSLKSIYFKTSTCDSEELSIYEKTFIYSLIMPFSTFKKEYIKYCENLFQNNEYDNMLSIKKWLDNKYWIHQYLGNISGINDDLALNLHNFYWELYYDELSEIVNFYYEKINKVIEKRDDYTLKLNQIKK